MWLIRQTMNKLLFIGDVHLNCGSFSKYVEYSLENIYQICIKEKPNKLIFLGDFLDNPTLTPDLVKSMSEWFSKFQTTADKVFLITGNHDKIPRYKNSSISFLSDQGVITAFNTYEDEDMVLISHNLSGVTVKSNGKIVAAHLGFDKVQVTENYNYNNSDIISFSDKPKLVILGHIHTPYFFEYQEIPIILPGNICPSNWSDSTNQRFIVKVEGKSVTNIPISHIKTKTVYSLDEVKDENDTVYRVILNENNDEKIPVNDNIKSIIIKKTIKPLTKNLTKESLIKSYCKQYNVNENSVKKILLEAGIYA